MSELELKGIIIEILRCGQVTPVIRKALIQQGITSPQLLNSQNIDNIVSYLPEPMRDNEFTKRIRTDLPMVIENYLKLQKVVKAVIQWRFYLITSEDLVKIVDKNIQ